MPQKPLESLRKRMELATAIAVRQQPSSYCALLLWQASDVSTDDVDSRTVKLYHYDNCNEIIAAAGWHQRQAHKADQT